MAQKVKVVLDREHYHRNEQCRPGQTIEVTPEQAQWLEREGIGHRSKGKMMTEEAHDEGATG